MFSQHHVKKDFVGEIPVSLRPRDILAAEANSLPPEEIEIPVPLFPSPSRYLSAMSRSLAMLRERGKARRLDECERKFRDRYCRACGRFKRREVFRCGLRYCEECSKRWTQEQLDAKVEEFDRRLADEQGYLYELEISSAAEIDKANVQELAERLADTIRSTVAERKFGAQQGPVGMASGKLVARAVVWMAQQLPSREAAELSRKAKLRVTPKSRANLFETLRKVLRVELPATGQERALLEHSAKSVHLTRASGVFYKKPRAAGARVRTAPCTADEKAQGFRYAQHCKTPCSYCGDREEKITGYHASTEVLDQLLDQLDPDARRTRNVASSFHISWGAIHEPSPT